MKVSTLLFTGGFIAFALHGNFELPRIDEPAQTATVAIQSLCIEDIDRRISEVQSVVQKFDRSERLLTHRLKELEETSQSAYSRSNGRRSRSSSASSLRS